MLVLLWWLTAGAAGPPETAAERLAACEHPELAETLDELSAKQQRSAIFELAKEDLTWRRYVCAADLTHLALTETGKVKPADERRLVEALTTTLDVAHARPARDALYEARFDDAEAILGRLAQLGHIKSMRALKSLSDLNRRRWRYERAKEALADG